MKGRQKKVTEEEKTQGAKNHLAEHCSIFRCQAIWLSCLNFLHKHEQKDYREKMPSIEHCQEAYYSNFYKVTVTADALYLLQQKLWPGLGTE